MSTHTHGRLANRTVLITGASSGIGAAIALAVAREGGNIIVHGRRDGDGLRRVAAACREAGVEVVRATADLAAADFAAEDLLARAQPLGARVDCLVSNAGAHFDVPFLDMDACRLDRTWRLNVRAGYLLTQALARRWVAAGVRGRIVMTGSINGELSEGGSTAYDASKAAVHGLVRALCAELAPHGIRVNALAPGLMRTAATAWLERSPERAAWAERHIPAALVPSADACAGAAVFLLSDEADYVQGHVLRVDGGLGAVQFPPAP
jgi:NAD(P)-dependent dehydrogenase (short-subunit alcohol dehydrogenase family)